MAKKAVASEAECRRYGHLYQVDVDSEADGDPLGGDPSVLRCTREGCGAQWSVSKA
jgi:hypothetical protein